MPLLFGLFFLGAIVAVAALPHLAASSLRTR